MLAKKVQLYEGSRAGKKLISLSGVRRADRKGMAIWGELKLHACDITGRVYGSDARQAIDRGILRPKWSGFHTLLKD